MSKSRFPALALCEKNRFIPLRWSLGVCLPRGSSIFLQDPRTNILEDMETRRDWKLELNWCTHRASSLNVSESSFQKNIRKNIEYSTWTSNNATFVLCEKDRPVVHCSLFVAQLFQAFFWKPDSATVHLSFSFFPSCVREKNSPPPFLPLALPPFLSFVFLFGKSRSDGLCKCHISPRCSLSSIFMRRWSAVWPDLAVWLMLC